MELRIHFQLAEQSLRFYRNCCTKNDDNEEDLLKEFEKFIEISKQNQAAEKLRFAEFGTL